MIPDLERGCCVDKSCTKETCMVLPVGQKCGQCRHFATCTMMGFTSSPASDVCDFFPRRFVLPKST